MCVGGGGDCSTVQTILSQIVASFLFQTAISNRKKFRWVLFWQKILATCSLDLFSTETSPERCWQAQRFQRVDEGRTIPSATLWPPEWFCIQMGIAMSHVNVSLLVCGGKVTIRQCPWTRASEEKGEMKLYWTEVLLLTSHKPQPLDQSGSQFWPHRKWSHLQHVVRSCPVKSKKRNGVLLF